ncbi:MAG: alpha/beta hydrolase [Acholeplasmatales bacterium]|jgi:pimeloyl-ACP methyl ester carboxylesterase|nr:alpha/beta hydrolase [Acholeplasmatales bacterium]
MNKDYLKLENGETIAYYYKKGTTNKTILLIHGNSSSAYFYMPLIDKLDNKYNVLAPDLRGFGDSSYNKSFDSLKELALDIKLLLEKLNIKDTICVGWSLGGGVALELALHNSLVKKLVLLNSTSHKGYPVFKKDENNQIIPGVVYNTKEEMSKDKVQVEPLLNIQKTSNAYLMDYILKASMYNVNPPLKEYQEICVVEALKQRCLVDADWALASLNMGNTNNLYTDGDNSITKIKQETVCTCGKNDLIVPSSMVDENVNAIVNSKKIVFEQCGHSPIVDKLDETKKLIEDLLA